MSTRIDQLIAAVRARGHTVWVGDPATPASVQVIVDFVGYPLPPSYLDFLRTCGTLTIYDSAVSGMVSNDPSGSGRGSTIADTERLRRDRQLPAGLLVVGPHEDGAHCLDLTRPRADGECPVINYERPGDWPGKPSARTFEEWLVEWQLEPWTEEDA